jgi:hypothetical protein
MARDFTNARRPGWGLRPWPKVMPWSMRRYGSVNYYACCKILQERDNTPAWLARLQGWFAGADCGGTNKLRRYVGPRWLWEEKEDDPPRRDGFWNKRHGAELPKLS